MPDQGERDSMLKIWFFSLISISLASFACAGKHNHKELSMTFMAKHISVSINRPATQVYEFASNPENLPKWTGGTQWLYTKNRCGLDS